MAKKTVSLISDVPVEAEFEIEERGMFGSDVGERHASISDVDYDTLKGNLQNLLNIVSSAFSSPQSDTDGMIVDEVNVSLGIDASGKVSLLSFLQGTVGVNSAIQVKLKRKRDG